MDKDLERGDSGDGAKDHQNDFKRGSCYADPDKIEEWVVSRHRPNIVLHLAELKRGIFPWTSKSKEVKLQENGMRVNFAEMQRMKLRVLQGKLVASAMKMRFKKPPYGDWEENLRKYVQALQDYDYMVTCNKLPRDPCMATSERMDDHWVLRSALEHIQGISKLPVGKVESAQYDFPSGPPEKKAIPIGNTRQGTIRSLRVAEFWVRFGLAFTGAAFLIAPMWIMVKFQWTAPFVTTVFVALFTFLGAFVLDRRDMLSCTAVYAAVLVVFVGASTGSG
ncbi:hypothetical protein F5Y19DRAFT_44054 [Xylariaceae sp. FL1651]|nr:hypothetical protein F5Y19DRAFT_44054 [Xylariaceae sp. FL1651]